MRRALILLLLISRSTWAFDLSPLFDGALETSRHYTSYYRIKEPEAATLQQYQERLQDPSAWFELAASTMDLSVSLMTWDLTKSDWPEPREAYDRRKHFGTWLRDEEHHTCMNTRALVLIRSSRKPVTYSENGCTVKTGEWYDPYAGQLHVNASEMQIDHMVPLKHAYQSGAWAWDDTERCAYTNFMANDRHLLAVSGHENMSKSDNAPDEYLPPNAAFVCEYLRDWLSVKLIWGLIMNPDETQAIKTAFERNHCDAESFRLTSAQLAEQRRAIHAGQTRCQ